MLSQLSLTRLFETTEGEREREKQRRRERERREPSRFWSIAQRKALSREIASVQNICIFRALYRGPRGIVVVPCAYGIADGVAEWPAVATEAS